MFWLRRRDKTEWASFGTSQKRFTLKGVRKGPPLFPVLFYDTQRISQNGPGRNDEHSEEHARSLDSSSYFFVPIYPLRRIRPLEMTNISKGA